MKPYVALFISLLAAMCASIIGFETLENVALSLHFRIRGKRDLHKSIVNVTIEDKSFFNYVSGKNKFFFPKSPTKIKSCQEFYNYFYWNTEFYIELLEKLQQYQPLLIVVIPAFPGTREDILPCRLTDYQRRKLSYLSEQIPVLWSGHLDETGTLIRPPGFLANDINFYNNIFPDADLFVRETSLKKGNLLSLAGAIWKHPLIRMKFYNSNFIDIDPKERFFISFSGSRKTNFQLPAVSFLKDTDTGWTPFIKDRIILVDIQSEYRNNFIIPYGDHRGFSRISNMQVQNEILNSLLRGTLIRRPSRILNIILSICLAALTIPAFFYFSLAACEGIALSLLSLFAVISIFLFGSLSIWINTATPLISASLAALLMTIWRYAQDERVKTLTMQSEIDELKGNFLSLISHNLKTPIAKIRALSSVILGRENDNLRNDQKEAVANILKSSRDLTSYITNILNITRIEAQKVKLHTAPCDVNVLIQQSIEKIKTRMEDKRINFDLNLEPIFSVQLDKDLFFQAFLNILENAVKYSPGGSTVTIASKEIDNRLQISVTDRGIGISKEDAEKIFEKFHRAKNIYTESITGTGLGLYLAKYFVELHGGEIKASGVPGEGTTFTINLPL